MSHVMIRSFIPGDLVFDIGAHSGDKAAWFQQLDLTVICVEPQPNMAEQLSVRFCNNPNVVVRQVGAGAKRGRMDMRISSAAPVLSTLASHWDTGRFSGHSWDRIIEVEVVLLDDLIEEYGVPRFCKIDVEGYEREVVSGLSRRIGIISFEFTSEFMDHAFDVIKKLVQLGYKKFNVSFAENNDFCFSDWKNFSEIVSVLQAARLHAGLWGDIYAN